MIIVTGASGLIGTAISKILRDNNRQIIGVDKRQLKTPDIVCIDTNSPEMLDILNRDDIEGVIHLAAVSRVIDAQNDPDLCFKSNVQCLSKVLMTLTAKKNKPWLIFASSREIYGQSTVFPVAETALSRPLNVYGYSKVAGETLCAAARELGLRVLIARFSSVYGSAYDHETRVVPAFVRRSIEGKELFIEGSDNTFDLTHISDVAQGLYKAVEYIESEKKTVPALHFVSGQGTTLGSLAQMVIGKTGLGTVKECPARNYDVHKFIGDPSLALKELGWKTEINIEQGVDLFIPEMRAYLESIS